MENKQYNALLASLKLIFLIGFLLWGSACITKTPDQVTTQRQINDLTSPIRTPLQDNGHSFTSLEEALINPSIVFVLALDQLHKKDFKQLSKFENLKELDLANTGITEIPLEIFSLKKLKILDLHTNKIRTIPSQIVNLSNLEVLVLSENLITEVPPAIEQLTSLRELQLDDNRITHFMARISVLKNLKSLGVGYNYISIDSTLLSSDSLQILYLNGNAKNKNTQLTVNLPGIRILHLGGLQCVFHSIQEHCR